MGEEVAGSVEMGHVVAAHSQKRHHCTTARGGWLLVDEDETCWHMEAFAAAGLPTAEDQGDGSGVGA